MKRPRRAHVSRPPTGTILLVAFAACVLWIKPMGLLLWARIRILTNIPRTAIAEPESAPEFVPSLELASPEVLVLPRTPSRDPFRPAAPTSQGQGTRVEPAKPHDPHNSNHADSSGRAGEAKSPDCPSDEHEAEGSGRSMQAGPATRAVADMPNEWTPDLPFAASAVRMFRTD